MSRFEVLKEQMILNYIGLNCFNRDKAYKDKCILLAEQYFSDVIECLKDDDIESFLGFKSNEIKAIKTWYEIFNSNTKTLSEIKSEFDIKNNDVLFKRFEKYLYDDFSIYLSACLFSLENPGLDSIIRLKHFFCPYNDKAHQARGNRGFKSIQELTRLTTGELKSKLLGNKRLSALIISAVHSLGFTFSDEVGIYDESLSDLIYILKQKENEILNSYSQTDSLPIDTDYLLMGNGDFNREMFETPYDAVLVKKK